MLLVRQENRPRHRHARRLRDDVVEELVVGAPPEGVVDHLRPGDGRRLQPGAVERHLVADAIEDDVVARDAILPEGAETHRLGGDAPLAAAVDLRGQGRRKGALLPEQDAHGPGHQESRPREFGNAAEAAEAVLYRSKGGFRCIARSMGGRVRPWGARWGCSGTGTRGGRSSPSPRRWGTPGRTRTSGS